MKKITVNKPSLFIMAEDGEPMPIGEAIEVEILDDQSKDDREELLNHIHTTGEIEIDFTPDYFNQKVITELFFGITNNCRRMHGGFALRERTKYRVHRKNKGMRHDDCSRNVR